MHLYLGHERTTNPTSLLAMTKEQFKAHVRAAAEAKYAEFNYRDMGPRIRAGREAYIAARMEHEWPLVEALQGLVDSVSYVDPGVYELDLAKAALSPYAAKPIER